MFRKITFFIILTNSLFGYVCQHLEKPEFNKDRTLFSTTENNCPATLDINVSSDEKNMYLYSEHFRVILGVNPSVLETEKAKKALEYAEDSWKKEVDELKFQKPTNSDKYFLDIYLGNTSAYNFCKSQYVGISSSYAGFASFYEDGTPYFTLNKSLEDTTLQATIAHEFFHTVQYSYFDGSAMSDEVWYRNIWFLEATAVLMENEVFSDNKDYIRFVDNYKNSIHRDIEYYNGSVEYGKALIFKFFREKYDNLDIIKNSLQNIDEKTRFLQILENDFTFHDDLLEFGKWIVNPSLNFSDGDLYLEAVPETSSLQTVESLGHLGFHFVKDSGEYYNSSNPQYFQSSFDGEKNKISDLQDGVVVLNVSNSTFDTGILQTNKKETVYLKKGWNLISNPFKESITLNEVFGDSLVWILRENDYFGYSGRNSYRIALENESIFTNELLGGEGAWVYSQEDIELNFEGEELISFEDLELDNNYKLLSLTSSTFSAEYLPKDLLIFYYDTENGWIVLKNGEKLPEFLKLEQIQQNKGYFIRKLEFKDE
jgi:hypothetical protein